MANTFSSVYIHIIFAVKNRNALIPPHWQPRIWAYIANILKEKGHIPVSIGGTSDHVHILFKYKITELLPDLVRDIKIASGKFIDSVRITPFKFFWQSGYGCFSYGASQVEAVKNYIDNQTTHHKGRTLREEIISYLDRCGIEYDEKYLFEDISSTPTGS